MEVEASGNSSEYVHYRNASALINMVASVSKSELEAGKVKDVSDLIEFLQTKSILFKIPYESVFDGRVMETTAPLPLTTREKPIFLMRKFISEPSGNTSESYFNDRKISLDKLIASMSFEDPLKEVENEPFNHTCAMLDLIYPFSGRENKESKGWLIGLFLREALPQDEKKVFVEEQFEIGWDPPRPVVDHAIINPLADSDFAVLVTEDKTGDRKKAILRNFDLLMRYSIENPHFESIFGIVSDLTHWTFLCYIPPKEGIPPSADNFLVSKTTGINIKPNAEVASNNFVRQVMRRIRCLVYGDFEKKNILI